MSVVLFCEGRLEPGGVRSKYLARVPMRYMATQNSDLDLPERFVLLHIPVVHVFEGSSNVFFKKSFAQ